MNHRQFRSTYPMMAAVLEQIRIEWNRLQRFRDSVHLLYFIEIRAYSRNLARTWNVHTQSRFALAVLGCLAAATSNAAGEAGVAEVRTAVTN